MCTQRSFISSGVEEEAGVDPEANNDLDVTTVADRGSEPLLRSAYVHPGDTPPKVRAERYEARAADNDDDVTAADADSPTVLFTNGADSVAINHNSSQNNAAAGAAAATAKNSWADVTADTVRLPPVTIVPRDDSSLRWRRFWALSRIKWLFLKRNRELLVYRIVIPLVMILAGAAVGSFVSLTSNDTSDDSVALTLTASVYARVDDQSVDEPNMTYAYGGTAPEADEILFTQQLQQNGVYLTETNDSYDFLNSEHYFHMGLTIFNATFVTSASAADDVSSANFTARYNDSAMHSLPVVQNTLTNAALGALGHSGVNVTAHAQRFANLEMDNIGWSNSVFWATFLLGMALSFPPATLALFVVKEREVSSFMSSWKNEVSIVFFFLLREGGTCKHCLLSRQERERLALHVVKKKRGKYMYMYVFFAKGER